MLSPFFRVALELLCSSFFVLRKGPQFPLAPLKSCKWCAIQEDMIARNEGYSFDYDQNSTQMPRSVILWIQNICTNTLLM